MASPAYGSGPRRVDDSLINLVYGEPQVICLRFVSGKNLGNSNFPPYQPRVVFSTVDDRKLFLDAEDASDFERQLAEQRVAPGELVKVTKIRMPRGGGHAIRVESVPDPDAGDAREPAPTRRPPAPATRLEAQLEQSVEIARTRGAAAFVTPAPAAMTPATGKMASAMHSAVDAVIDAQQYAATRGLGVTFSEESVRAIALSIYISASRGN